MLYFKHLANYMLIIFVPTVDREYFVLYRSI